MKSTVVKILAFMLAVMIPFGTCFAVKLDGADDGVEWNEAQFDILLDKKAGNNVNYGLVYTLVDKNGFDVYFLIFFSESPAGDYSSSGIILTLDASSITVDCKGNVYNPDPDSFLVSSKVRIEENDGCYIEMKVGFKRGLPEDISAKLCFIDSKGTHSYHYPFSVKNNFVTTMHVSESEVNPTSEATINERSTVLKTARHTTTKVKTTKPKSTRAASNVKRTQKPEAGKTVVYFYEKEVVVSEVYADGNLLAPVEPVCDVYAANAVHQAPTVIDENAAKYNEGVKIFRVVCVVAGALLAVFAVWTGLNGRRNEKKTANESSSKTESAEKNDDNKK